MSTGGLPWTKGWPGFAIGHKINIGYFLTFKVLRGDVYRVRKCPEHDLALSMIDK
jgi:hypothetical protein